MALFPVQFPGFGGGLNLRSQPDETDETQAIDLLNVTFTEQGAVKSRDGYGLFTATPGTNRYDCMTAFYTSTGTRQLVVGDGTKLEGLNTSGAIVASTTAPTASPHFFARYGGELGEYIYAANGTDNIRRWDGAAWSAPAMTGTAPTGKYLAVTPWDNRMVCARYGTVGTAGINPSSVRFSDPGLPTTWGANNYVDLNPGDGQQIQGVVTWNNQVFVFKDSSIYSIYGVSTDSTGQPVFNYRMVDPLNGAASPRAIVAARDGVYFLNQRGIYKTAGGPAVSVSGLLDPLFLGAPSDFYTGGVLNQASITTACMAFHREQIFVGVPTGSSTANNATLVYDTRYGWWTLYDIPAAAMTSFQVTAGKDELMFAYASGTKDIGRHSGAYTTDAGATITSRWSSGWFDYGYGRNAKSRARMGTTVKTIRESKLWGKGSLFFGLGKDFTPSANQQLANFTAGLDLWADGTNAADLWADGTNAADTWGAGRSITPRLVRQAIRGTTFSIQITNNGANPWALYKLANHVRGDRAPTVVRTENY